MADAGVSNGYFKEGNNNSSGNYMRDKLSGKT
jgi:hypothetical protein